MGRADDALPVMIWTDALGGVTLGFHKNSLINCLIRIPKNDALRERGFQIVTDWVKNNCPEAFEDPDPEPDAVVVTAEPAWCIDDDVTEFQKLFDQLYPQWTEAVHKLTMKGFFRQLANEV
jgi:hypothetical protein